MLWVRNLCLAKLFNVFFINYLGYESKRMKKWSTLGSFVLLMCMHGQYLFQMQIPKHAWAHFQLGDNKYKPSFQNTYQWSSILLEYTYCYSTLFTISHWYRKSIDLLCHLKFAFFHSSNDFDHWNAPFRAKVLLMQLEAESRVFDKTEHKRRTRWREAWMSKFDTHKITIFVCEILF